MRMRAVRGNASSQLWPTLDQPRQFGALFFYRLGRREPEPSPPSIRNQTLFGDEFPQQFV
jgi:hypothetical protein